MAGDIEKSLLRALVEMEGVDVSQSFLQSLQVLYGRFGEDYIYRYSGDSFFNTLNYDRHEEETILRIFSNIILKAGNEYLQNPFGTLIPSWERVLSVYPTLRNDLKEAAEQDLKEVA